MDNSARSNSSNEDLRNNTIAATRTMMETRRATAVTSMRTAKAGMMNEMLGTMVRTLKAVARTGKAGMTVTVTGVTRTQGLRALSQVRDFFDSMSTKAPQSCLFECSGVVADSDVEI
jgi:hypothetical protein